MAHRISIMTTILSSSRLFVISLMLVSTSVVIQAIAQPISSDSAANVWLDNSLGRSLDITSAGSRLINDPLVLRALRDDISGEFERSKVAFSFVLSTLQAFGDAIHLDTRRDNGPDFLERHFGGWKPSTPIKQAIAKEIEHLYKSIEAYMQTAAQMIEDRPLPVDSSSFLDPSQLTHRCDRPDRILNLRSLGSNTPLYDLLFDILANELYSHCLRRKLTLLKIKKIKPPPTVRLFIDLYLDIPPRLEYSLSSGSFEQKLHSLEEFASKSLRFRMEDTIAQKGFPLKVAELVETTSISMLMMTGHRVTSPETTLNKFQNECRAYSEAVSEVWTTFDQFAHFISSQMNDLASFNQHIKLVEPELAYAYLCMQFAQLPVN